MTETLCQKCKTANPPEYAYCQNCGNAIGWACECGSYNSYMILKCGNCGKTQEKLDLDSIIEITIPTYLEPGTTSEIIIYLRNETGQELYDISFDLSDMEHFFTVKGDANIPFLRPNMNITRRLTIQPKEQEGTFPVKIRIRERRASLEKLYSIKVGGTEIY